MEYLAYILIIGVGATMVTDLWAAVRTSLFHITAPHYGLVGRWVAHMPHGQFLHDSIAAATRVRGELVIGWTAHYLIGIGYAAVLFGIWGPEWIRQPTIGPALVVGVGTVAAPFLLMQPGMGAGIAASRTPRPNAARIQSLIMHTIFGLGLYAAGLVANVLFNNL